MSKHYDEDLTMDPRAEIDRLFDLEYGRRVDLAFRFGLIILGGVTLNLYTGLPMSLYWMAGLIVLHLIHFLYMRTRGETCSRRELLISGATYWAVVAAFIWLPAWMIVQEDPALRIGGAAGIGALLVFLIHRADRVLTVMLGEIAVIGAAIVWILYETLLKIDSLSAQIGVAVTGGGLWIYFSVTMFTNRRIRIEAERAAQRSVQAQKMEAIGQLAGGVAHDFNNILTAVIGNLDLYEGLETDADRQAAVNEARMAASRASDLVQQLLAYARRSPMQVARRDVGALLEQLELLTRRLLPARITQTFEAPRDPLWVALDESQFITALVNLVVNARDAMPDGGTLTVTARPVHLFTEDQLADGTVLAAGEYAEVTVADTGTGIPDEILRRVTEPFFTTKEVGQGSGLGLSMVEGFVRQSGGSLSINSSDEGTAMHLLLPIAASDGALDDTAAAMNANVPPSASVPSISFHDAHSAAKAEGEPAPEPNGRRPQSLFPGLRYSA
ncbi:signal transduction histidine kinase [Rhodobacter aestuarii]|uniref:histidine kinase n=1 Tax=Rhodobacter aestuarii TaxID=453582 RepID=A0A1N7KWM3_9RHOB|nr:MULTISPECIES: ATP-binding protein [Rhodobacter]PTV95531.1 signal transduction histidine kinase [Rhodobacter aestuarii]SIS65941.1 Signal transduction histidine kinase [Rhodobacter aestuarii]SOB89645.1 signal transduction histidine kinase [Rhodobacter sp. JA431]